MIAKIFIAGPYTNGDTGENVHKAYKAANELADYGYAPFVPHATHFWHLILPRPYEFWIELDRQFLPLCDGLLRLPGQSHGADEEVHLARDRGLPVFTSIPELRAHFESPSAKRSVRSTESSRASRFFERSVNSVQGIYAVIIALAVSKAFDTFLTDGRGHVGGFYSQPLAKWVGIIAFLVTLVPFWHGMNRHLDRFYLEKIENVRQRILLLDFWVFFLEAGWLFAAAYSLGNGFWTFYDLGILLGVDMVWGAVSHRIHSAGQPSHVLQWSKINLGAIGLAALTIRYSGSFQLALLLVIAVARTAVDYGCGWDFYFP